MKRVRDLLSALLVVVAMATPASAQYFGQNKVQYRRFAFEVLSTAHFDIYFYAESRPVIAHAARMAERWYSRLSRVLGHELTGRQPLIIYASHPDFQQTNVIEGELGEGVGGVTELLKRRIVLPLAGPLSETDHVIGHELVHAFQFDIGEMFSVGASERAGNAVRLPLWFVEGMAEYLTRGPVDPQTAMWMHDAASQERLPTIPELKHPRYFPYRWGHSLWAYIAGRWGEPTVGALFRTAVAAGNVEAAMPLVLGVSAETLSSEWHLALRRSASAVRQRTRRVTDEGTPIARVTHDLASVDVSPVLSPDARHLMYLSQRGVLSIDLFLVDVASGRVLRKVTDTALDPHFTSLGFVKSAGTWSPDGRRFAFAVVRGGKPGLVITNVAGNLTERELVLDRFGEVFGPDWSPDGTSIAFAALTGGATDLFALDLESGEVRRLTDDVFTDLMPAWCPDGRRVAFATDRFSSRMADLTIGNLQVVVLDVASGNLSVVPGATAGQNINPQWLDADTLVFVSDRTGISNIYTARVESGEARPLTNVPTGISGLTALSPAISLAADARRLAFSAYQNGKFGVYLRDLQAVRPDATVPGWSGVEPAHLPPTPRRTDPLSGASSGPAREPAPDVPVTVRPYRARLQLDLVAQPVLTTGVDAYGAFASGGMALFWSDMLGDHTLGAAVQISTSFNRGLTEIARSSGGQVLYQNRTRRWNWTLGGGQTPYLAGAVSARQATEDGRVVGTVEQVIFRQVERSATALTAFPFDRATRFEAAVSFASLSFDRRHDIVRFDVPSGQVLSTETRTVTGGETLNLGTVSAALVHDTAIYGATSPIVGQSWRLQVSPTSGSLRYQSVLADYRRYIMPVSFYTLAARALHYGRYGHDAEDPRLVPLYLGYPNLVRGYDMSSFDAAECTPTASGSCHEFDRLTGSRILVANLEFRFPLLRPFGVKTGMYGPMPIELGFFGDAGVAWHRGEKPALWGGDRRGVASAGVAVRTNIFGIVLAEFDFVKPFQRTGRGWVFQFSLAPAF